MQRTIVPPQPVSFCDLLCSAINADRYTEWVYWGRRTTRLHRPVWFPRPSAGGFILGRAQFFHALVSRRKMKVRFQRLSTAGACALVSLAMAGCRQDMHNQPKMIPQRHSALFSDGRSARQQVTGTVSREQSVAATYLTTGLINGAEGDGLPFPVTQAVMERGQERYNIYCTPCHSRVGNGKGAIVGRGFYAAGNFQSARLRQASLGHFFWVITHGYGAMPNYSVEIAPEDRWAIAAYIRALQLSQSAERSDVPA